MEGNASCEGLGLVQAEVEEVDKGVGVGQGETQ